MLRMLAYVIHIVRTYKVHVFFCVFFFGFRCTWCVYVRIRNYMVRMLVYVIHKKNTKKKTQKNYMVRMLVYMYLIHYLIHTRNMYLHISCTWYMYLHISCTLYISYVHTRHMYLVHISCTCTLYITLYIQGTCTFFIYLVHVPYTLPYTYKPYCVHTIV